jgi:hypothetical protein
MKTANRSQRHQINHNLRNQILDGRAARQLKQDMVEKQVENDPWYQYNMGGLLRNLRLGKVAAHVFKNVQDRLYRIAHHRAQESIQGF